MKSFKNDSVIRWSMSLYVVLGFAFVLFSYGFVDKNLTLSTSQLYENIHDPLASLVFDHRESSAGIYLLFLAAYFMLYAWLLRIAQKVSVDWLKKLICFVPLILVFSYSAVSYDIFNYMTTAKVVYTHRENPYIIMPVDIPNEPNLAFTRAANKVALYGPTWLAASWLPHTLGAGNIWITMILFKAFAAVWFWTLCYFLWRITKSAKAVIYFALNPLILIEVIVSGHNDIVMMTLVVAALVLVRTRGMWAGFTAWMLFILSVGVKAASVVLLPFMNTRLPLPVLWRYAFWLLLVVFLVATPIREELYPWYAVWFLIFAALLVPQKRALETGLAVAFSVGLELRHIPYIAMGYYEGPGPMARLILTVVPVALFLFFYYLKRSDGRV